ncbi:hypothetical protein K439DRAFT_1632626 [Ramaria rubella]|nr:hypothetical protein K439DRAFT_1632626 [Ramaria rubella]
MVRVQVRTVDKAVLLWVPRMMCALARALVQSFVVVIVAFHDDVAPSFPGICVGERAVFSSQQLHDLLLLLFPSPLSLLVFSLHPFSNPALARETARVRVVVGVGGTSERVRAYL